MSKPFFRVELLPARHGDAILVEYGKTSGCRRMLIDGGPLSAYPQVEARLSALPEGDRRVELVVITHVDADHIEGTIRLLASPISKWPIALEEIWFNGWRHLEEESDLGGYEGDLLSALIRRRANDKWNARAAGRAIRVGTFPKDQVTLEDGLTLTLLSPDERALASLLDDWEKSALRREINPGDLDDAWDALVDANRYHPGSELTLGPDDLTENLRNLLRGKDPSAANGSSIAFIATFEGMSCMFLADANMRVVCDSLKRLGYSKTRPCCVDAVKLSHHGSKNNTTPEFLELVDTKHYLISTNGDQHGHPDRPTIEAIVRGSRSQPTFWFNYRSPSTEEWEAESLMSNPSYCTKYPDRGQQGILVAIDLVKRGP